MAGRREGRRDGCSEGELEVNGTFSQAASFKSTGTGSQSPALASPWPGVERTGLNAVTKPDFP